MISAVLSFISMNTPKRVVRILLTAWICAATPALAAAPDGECGERMTLAKLIANPDAYHGKALWVVAYATIDFENMTACPSENETQAGNCLWLNVDDGPFKTDQDYIRYQSKLQIWRQFNLQTVAICATFNKTETGHFGVWRGGLGNVMEVSGHGGGWNFSSNAAVPRTACVGELPVPEESSERRIGHGNLKLRNGDYEGAIADFNLAIDLEPRNSRYYLLRGNAKKLNRDYAGAIADYTRAIELEREYKDVMFTTRAGARELTGDLDGAIADYSRAIEIDPKFGGTYKLRGFARQKKGDLAGAAADFAQAERLAPKQ